MRILSRFIGAILGICGLAFLVISAGLTSVQDMPGHAKWTAVATALALSAGLLTASWYFLALKNDSLDATTESQTQSLTALTKFLVEHIRLLRVVAGIGIAASVSDLAILCIRAETLPRWIDAFLLFGVLGLVSCCIQLSSLKVNSDFTKLKVSAVVRRRLSGMAFAALFALFFVSIAQERFPHSIGVSLTRGLWLTFDTAAYLVVTFCLGQLGLVPQGNADS